MLKSGQIPDLVRDLFTPVEVETFLEEHWSRRPLFVGGSAAKHEWLDFSVQRFLELAGDDVSNARLKAAFVDQAGRHAEMKPRRRDIEHLVAMGATISLGELQRTGGAFARLATALKIGLGQDRVSVSGFYSPDASGYRVHYDSSDVLVLQLAGSKHWRYSTAPAVSNPPENFGPNLREPSVQKLSSWLEPPSVEDAEFVSDDLRPGDVLYLPAGTWHEPTAEGASLHLSVALSRRSSLDVLVDHLNGSIEELKRQARFREPPPPDSPDSLLADADILGREARFRQAIDALREVLEGLPPTELVARWLDDVYRPIEAEASADEAELEPSTAVAWRSFLPIRTLASESEGTVRYFVPGSALTLPADAGFLMREIAARPRFRAGDACDWTGDSEARFEWSEVEPLLRQLVRCGLLDVVC